MIHPPQFSEAVGHADAESGDPAEEGIRRRIARHQGNGEETARRIEGKRMRIKGGRSPGKLSSSGGKVFVQQRRVGQVGQIKNLKLNIGSFRADRKEMVLVER